MSMSTRSGFSRGISLRASSPLEAVVNSISGESNIRRNEYCTSASSSINSSLSMVGSVCNCPASLARARA